jgi:hypothetical protein
MLDKRRAAVAVKALNRELLTPEEQELLQSAKMTLQNIASGDTISDLWSVDDVLERGGTLSVEDARKILEIVDRQMDATIGINWDSIDAAIWSYQRDNG